MYDEDCPFTDELQEPLKTLCENTGAVVYGGRYVLLESERCGKNIQSNYVMNQTNLRNF